MERKEAVKLVVDIVVSVGVSAVIGNAVKATTPLGVGRIKRLCIGVGTLVLTNMATDKAIEYTDKLMDKISKTVKVEIKHTEVV